MDPHAVATALPLCNATLDAHAKRVEVPTYDRSALTPGIVHIGVGGFHRSHQETYLDELARRGVTEWGVVGVGLNSRSMKEALEPQDLLYTVVERDGDGDAARIVGTLDRYLYAPEDPEAVLEALADHRVRLVTLTVTAGGYHLDDATGRLDDSAKTVVADLRNPRRPTTFLGYVVEALDRRRRAGAGPFTVLSCDNVPHNGDVTRAAVVSFARLRDPDLAAWIDQRVSFPSSMVDRITPETTGETPALLERQFGIEDNWPVVTEPFRQWVVEDTFCNGRPPLEDVGVQIVDDVRPYELMKKRLLNGSHCALGYLGFLAGHRTTDAAMADPSIRDYIGRLMEDEVAPLLPEVPGIDLDDYRQTLLDRFANPKIKDELQRLCGRGSTKMPSYLLPSIRAARSAGARCELLTLAVAGWLRYLRGVDFDGGEIPIMDARKEELQPLAIQDGAHPRAMLVETSLFGDLAEDADFVASLRAAARALDRDGPRATVDAYLRRAAMPTEVAA